MASEHPIGSVRGRGSKRMATAPIGDPRRFRPLFHEAWSGTIGVRVELFYYEDLVQEERELARARFYVERADADGQWRAYTDADYATLVDVREPSVLLEAFAALLADCLLAEPSFTAHSAEEPFDMLECFAELTAAQVREVVDG